MLRILEQEDQFFFLCRCHPSHFSNNISCMLPRSQAITVVLCSDHLGDNQTSQYQSLKVDWSPLACHPAKRSQLGTLPMNSVYWMELRLSIGAVPSMWRWYHTLTQGNQKNNIVVTNGFHYTNTLLLKKKTIKNYVSTKNIHFKAEKFSNFFSLQSSFLWNFLHKFCLSETDQEYKQTRQRSLFFNPFPLQQCVHNVVLKKCTHLWKNNTEYKHTFIKKCICI